MAGNAEQKLTEMGLSLPDAPAPAANYVPFTIVGNTLTISGQISKTSDGSLLQGRLGDDVDVP
ncbi:MAG: Atu1372/SO_1960 family protein, partial [Pseudomonadota bacterium]